MVQKGISVVVPVIAEHKKFLWRLLKNIKSWTLEPLEIILVASGFTVTEHELTSLQSIVDGRVRVITTARQAAGLNRQVGWEFAQGIFTCFIDADDLYHRKRLALMTEALNSQEMIRAVTTSYLPVLYTRGLSIATKIPLGLLGSSEMEFVQRPKDLESTRHLELEGAVSTNLDSKSAPIHHGHVLVSNVIRGQVRFTDLKQGEDAIFLRDILRLEYEVIHIPQRLSVYRLNSPKLRHVERWLSSPMRNLSKRRSKC